MKFLAFITYAFIPLIKSFLDTIVFRSEKCIFPAKWSPFITYGTTPLTLGIIRLDPYHKGMYAMIAFIIATIILYLKFGAIFGYWDIAIFCIEWGIFFEVPWRLFYKKPVTP